MKRFFIVALLYSTTFSLFADYAKIKCGAKKSNEVFLLSLDETSDISIKTASFFVNETRQEMTRIETVQTDYGILTIKLQTGYAPNIASYAFKNLGSSSCFGGFNSNQSGSAYIEKLNTSGENEKQNCKCEVN